MEDDDITTPPTPETPSEPESQEDMARPENMASPGDKQADSRKDPPKADTPRKPTDDELSIKALKNRIHDLNQRFLLKERLQLGFIFDNLPRAYYLSWKIDGNECFSLMVNLKRRLKELEAKKTRR